MCAQDTVYDRFVELAAERARKRVLGDPYDPKTQQGPQASCPRGCLRWGTSRVDIGYRDSDESSGL